MLPGLPADLKDLKRLVARGEGQQVSDSTQREIAQTFKKFEPPVTTHAHRVSVGSGREVLILRVAETSDSVPFTFDSRPYERTGSTTRKMPQARYEKLLLARGHAKRRWENLPAEGLALKDLDRKEILRTRELAIQQNRIPPDTSRDVGDILDRLGLRRSGVLTQAAQVLYGKEFLANYPQCLLKMGRFRGPESPARSSTTGRNTSMPSPWCAKAWRFSNGRFPWAPAFPKARSSERTGSRSR